MDIIEIADLWLEKNLPQVHQFGEAAYEKGSKLLAPLLNRVNKTWDEYGPKLSENLFKQAFYLGAQTEKRKWSYFTSDEDQPSEEESTWKTLRNFTKGHITSNASKRDLAPSEEASAIFEKVKKGFIDEKEHDPAPLNAMCMEIFWGSSQVVQKLRGKTEIGIDEGLSHLERAAIHAGRAYYRRSQHLFYNLGHAVRWIVLWHALGSLHPWARTAGFSVGLACAFGTHTKALGEKMNGRAEMINFFSASARKVTNRGPRFLQSTTMTALGLVLWHKSGIPQISPLASFIATFLLASGAGHYVGAPIESIVLKADQKKPQEKSE